MKVYAANLTAHLVKADVIKALEARAVNGSHSMVGHQEVLLPSHKDVLALSRVLDVDLPPLKRLLDEGPEGGKVLPMTNINLVGRTPGRMLCNEAILWANYLSLKIGCQGRMIISQA